MKTAPLSFTMVVGTSATPAPAQGVDASFAAELTFQLASRPVVDADTTSPAGRTADLSPLLGVSPLPQAALAPMSPMAMGEPAFGGGAVAPGGGIFGYGRSAMFDSGARAQIDVLRASAPPVLSPTRSAPASSLRHDFKALLAGLADEFDVPESFITAVMLAESGGDPNAVGDNGHSVGLFQLHDRGMGYGMGDDRYDPEKNARVGVAGLAGSWHDGVAKGLKGEALVRFAYDDKFNPGGGWAYQGNRVVANWNALEMGSSGPGGAGFARDSLAWPVSGGHVTQHSHAGHSALDIGVPTGTPVRAVAGGVVTEVERLTTGYGWYVTVDHGNGWSSRYAHASEIDVGVGQAVMAGQVLMLSGNTGKSTGPHLHFEIMRGGERLDPEAYLAG